MPSQLQSIIPGKALTHGLTQLKIADRSGLSSPNSVYLNIHSTAYSVSANKLDQKRCENRTKIK